MILFAIVVTLVFLFPLALLPVGDLIDTRRKRQARYDEFFTVRYARSIGRVVVESPLDRRLLNQWCSQGNKGGRRARCYIELWDVVSRVVADEFLRRIGRIGSY